MGRYRCAIGGCPEKTYRHQPGVRFFHVKTTPEPLKGIWKEKIFATRADIGSVDQINDVMICSRHFENGDKNTVPTIFPYETTSAHSLSRSTHFRKQRFDDSSDSDSRNGHSKPTTSRQGSAEHAISVDTSDSDTEVNGQ